MNTRDDIANDVLRYVALGDSYTIGEGVLEEERWPNLLVDSLADSGIEVMLVANPSRTGWTTQQVLDKEMDVFRDSDPDFATLMIGVNDYFQGVSSELFRERFSRILDEMQAELENPQHIVIITIPDYSLTPTGALYDDGDVSIGLSGFNQIILEEAAQRSLLVVDIFELSQQVVDHPDWLVSDALHPSGIQYAAWNELISPVLIDLLKK